MSLGPWRPASRFYLSGPFHLQQHGLTLRDVAPTNVRGLTEIGRLLDFASLGRDPRNRSFHTFLVIRDPSPSDSTYLCTFSNGPRHKLKWLKKI